MTGVHLQIRLRPARHDDAGRLLQWRNDPSTVAASLVAKPVTEEEHANWLAGVLADPNRQLFIAEESGIPVGMARADRREGCWELSWSVDPVQRGRGLAKQIVRELVASLEGPVVARIRAGNHASIRVAEATGFRQTGEQDGILQFERVACTGRSLN